MPNPPQLRPVFQDDAPPALMSPMTGSMASAPPDMGVTPAPMVSRIPTTGEQNIAHDEAKLQKVQWNQEHPWGTPENHPGKLGKVAHAFSVLGNIAGNIVAPGVMANIPQTQLGMKAEEGQLAKRVNQEQTSEAENQERQAQTAKTQEDTTLEPGKVASTEALQGAQTENLQGKTPAEPTLAQGYAHAVNEAIKKGLDPAQDPIVQHMADAITSLQRQPNAPKENDFEQFYKDYLADNHLTDSAHARLEARSKFAAAGQMPQRAPQVTIINPAGQIQTLHPGDTVAPGSMSPTQFGQGSAADVKTNKAQEASAANLDSELNLMKQFAANPSPTNDAAMLMHYIGATKPESMGKIRLNDRELKLFGGTRSSLGDVEALFTKVANGQSLTPKQRNDMVNTMTMIAGAAKRGSGGAEPSRPANVPEGYKYNQNGPKGAGWYAPAAK